MIFSWFLSYTAALEASYSHIYYPTRLNTFFFRSWGKLSLTCTNGTPQEAPRLCVYSSYTHYHAHNFVTSDWHLLAGFVPCQVKGEPPCEEDLPPKMLFHLTIFINQLN